MLEALGTIPGGGGGLAKSGAETTVPTDDCADPLISGASGLLTADAGDVVAGGMLTCGVTGDMAFGVMGCMGACIGFAMN